MFNYDGEGVTPSKFELLPDGKYLSEITDAAPTKAKSSGNDMVTVHYKVVKPDIYKGRKIMYHNVVFVPKGEQGAGMTLHYLKSIGEPHEGKFAVNPKNWVGKRLTLTVGHKEYNGRTNNNVLSVDAADYTVTAPAEEIPF